MIMSEGDNMEITYRKASLKDLYNILSFCSELKEEKAKMSFCDVDNTSEIQSWIDNSNMYLFLAVDEVNNNIAGMFLAKRGLNNWFYPIGPVITFINEIPLVIFSMIQCLCFSIIIIYQIIVIDNIVIIWLLIFNYNNPKIYIYVNEIILN